jgi:hypothetical protein
VVSRFIPFAERTICEEFVDISSTQNAYSAYQSVKAQIKFNPKNLYRIHLVGEIDYDNDALCQDLEKLLANDCYFISVKDGTQRKIDFAVYEGDISLRGEFIRAVTAHSEWSEEKKRQVIALGLKALSGREVE